jgi:hypothetical protein
MATRRQFVAGKGDAPCRFSSVYGSQGLRLGLRLKGTSGQRRLGAVVHLAHAKGVRAGLSRRP